MERAEQVCGGRLNLGDIDKRGFIGEIYKGKRALVRQSSSAIVVINKCYSFYLYKSKVTLLLKMKALFAVTVLSFIIFVFTEPVIVPDCPEVDGPNATLLKDPYHCDSYYMCLEGEAIPMKCPVGLHFNDVLKICDYPKKAKCKALPPPSID